MVHSNARIRFGEVSNRVVISVVWLNKTSGGNEALPPQWQLYEVGGDVRYQDDNLMMVSCNRPLPGMRLGELRKCYHEQGTYFGHRWTWIYCGSRMRMAHLTTRSVLLRQPQFTDHVVEETNTRTSSGELDAGVHRRGSFWVHISPCLRRDQWQRNKRIKRLFNSPVDKRRKASRKTLAQWWRTCRINRSIS